MAEEKRKSVGAIWKKMTKNGEGYFSIDLDGKKYVAFRNDYMIKDTAPDYKIYPAQSSQAAPKKEVKEDDIPF